jgi:hypothetical protein
MVFLPTSGKLVRSSCVYADLNCALSISALLLLARPVSLTAICSKILEHIIYSNIFHKATYYRTTNMDLEPVDLVKPNS